MSRLPAASASSSSPFRLTASGLAVTGTALPWRGLAFGDAVLRGLGQVMLQNNSYAGLLFLVGIFYNSPLFGGGALLGAIASTATARAFGASPADRQAGLYGFNGALVGVALLYFLVPGPLALVYVVLAAAGSTVLMAALQHLFGSGRLPPLTAPFVLVTLAFILACARFGRLPSTALLPTAGLPAAATVEGVVTASTLGEGLLKGVAQIFFQDNLVTGVCFVLGLLVSSRQATIAALLGSGAGAVTAWVLGAAEPAIRNGAFGFNSALTAIALGGGLAALNFAGLCYVTLATVTTAILYAALSAALQPLGMPALTLPFVLVVWIFWLARPAFPSLRPVGA